ncbi:uncharacterized protein [Haliotis asinina]|uniref:uncharacterized protein n=1 Tax=Haliotis asinina TaxID=109174 RepID=UPI003531C53C
MFQAHILLVSVLVGVVSSQTHPKDFGHFGPSPDNVIDVVPHHSAVGGNGDFITDPVHVHGGDGIHVVHDPQSHSVVKDVVPDPGNSGVVDVVTGSSSGVVDVVPESGSEAIVPDVTHNIVPKAFSDNVVHDVVPSSDVIVHDVVSASTFPQAPPDSGIVKDILPNAASLKPDFPTMPHPDFPETLPATTGALTTSPSLKADVVSTPVVNPAVLKCGLQPEPYVMYQFSDVSYSYPKDDIIFELEQRPKIRAAIFYLGTGGRFKGKYNLHPHMAIRGQRLRRQASYTDGCQGQSLTLRRFYSYNNYCWVINPVYQDVIFYSCGRGCTTKASYGTVSRCEASYRQTGVWAYCAGLAFGERITKVTIPMPTACTCKTYQCS